MVHGRIIRVLIILLLASQLLYPVITASYNKIRVSETRAEVPFYISFVFHLHQPIYDVSRNICELVQSGSDVYNVFNDRSAIYTYRILDLVDFINNNNLPVNISIDITGTLIENFENLTVCASSIPGLENYTYIAENWSSRDYSHVEFMSTMYHYNILPMLKRFSGDVAYPLLDYSIWLHNESLHSFTGRYPGFEGIVGFHPPELALDNDSLGLLAKLGYNYTYVDDIHIYRIFPDYINSMRPPDAWYTGKAVNIKTDPLYIDESLDGNWVFLSFEHYGLYTHIMDPYIGLRPHAVSTPYGDIVVFPRNRYFSVLMHAIMYFTGNDIDQAIELFFSKISYLEQFNNDPSRPFILPMVFDGDNGDPLTYQTTWWQFMRKIMENVTTPGSRYSYVKIVSPGWYLKHVYNPIYDNEWRYAHLPFIEPGSWNTNDGWGDPYFTKWIYPSKYSYEQKMLVNITRAIAYYINARQASPNDPRLNESAEKLLLALQSDWFYFASLYWLENSSYAAYESISISNIITSTDNAGPAIMYAWFENPDNNYWPGIVYSDTHPFIKVHILDVSGISQASITIYTGQGTLTYSLQEDPDLPGNYYAQITSDLPPGATIKIKVSAKDQKGYESSIHFTLCKVIDGIHRLNGIVDTNSRPAWINTTNTVLQYLFLNDTGDQVYLGFNTTTRGSGYDTFLFISENPLSGTVQHPWSKNGYVPKYVAYMGMEESNGWYGLWFQMNGDTGTRKILVASSWPLDYYWDPVNGFAEVLMAKNLFSTDRIFLGVAAWGTNDYDGIYEKLRMVSTSNTLYKDEMVGVYLGEPTLIPYFTPEQGVGALSAIITSIRNARAYIYMAIYNFNNYTLNTLVWSIAEELVNAKQRGVWVAVVVDNNNKYKDPIQYLMANGIYVVDDNSNDIMHMKFIVIDGVEIYFGSANLVDEAFYKVSDGSYQYNDMVHVYSTWFSKPFEYEFIEMYYKHVFHGGIPLPSEMASQRILLNGTRIYTEFYFLPENGSDVENLLNELLASSTNVSLMTYLLTLNSIGESLVNLWNTGTRVRVILDYYKRGTTGTEYYKLLDHHIPVALDYNAPQEPGTQIMHHKVFIFNETIIATGSMNPSFSALYRNDEDLVIMHWKSLAEKYTERFNELWNNFTAKINVEVYYGDKPARSAFVNLTVLGVSGVTNGRYEYYNYTGYTDTNGRIAFEVYLWSPDPTSLFTVNASLGNLWNTTIFELGLDNNTYNARIWLTKPVTPKLIINGPSEITACESAVYTIRLLYPNGTIISIDALIRIYVNGSLLDEINIVSGEATWSHRFTDIGLATLLFESPRTYWINGLLVEPVSNTTILNVTYCSQQVAIEITGPGSFYYGEEATYTVRLLNATDNTVLDIDTTVHIYLNATLANTVQLEGGIGIFTLNYDKAGRYLLIATYPGGDTIGQYQLAGAQTIADIEIYETTPTIEISAPPSAYVGEDLAVVIHLYNPYSSEPLVGEHVELYIDGNYITTLTTNSSGECSYIISFTTPGIHEFTAIYRGSPDKYLETSTSTTINIIENIPTKIVIIGPETTYIMEPTQYRIELRFQNDTVIPLDADLLLCINGSRSTVQLINGVYMLSIIPSEPGNINITAVFNGYSTDEYNLEGSRETLIAQVTKRPIDISANIEAEWLNDTHIHIYVEVNISDRLSGQPLNTGYALFYLDKNGSFVLIGNETIINGKAVLNTTVDPIPQPRLEIVFSDPSGIYVSGGEEGSYKIYTLPQRTPPLPEPWVTPLLIITAVIVFTIIRRAKTD